MLVVLGAPQRAGGAQVVDDRCVGVEDEEPGVGSGFLREAAGRVDRIENRKIVFDAGFEIVGAVARGGVHRAGSGFEIDVIGEHDLRVAVHQRMAHGEAVEVFTHGPCHHRGLGETRSERALRERLGKHDTLVPKS